MTPPSPFRQGRDRHEFGHLPCDTLAREEQPRVSSCCSAPGTPRAVPAGPPPPQPWGSHVPPKTSTEGRARIRGCSCSGALAVPGIVCRGRCHSPCSSATCRGHRGAPGPAPAMHRGHLPQQLCPGGSPRGFRRPHRLYPDCGVAEPVPGTDSVPSVPRCCCFFKRRKRKTTKRRK